MPFEQLDWLLSSDILALFISRQKQNDFPFRHGFRRANVCTKQSEGFVKYKKNTKFCLTVMQWRRQDFILFVKSKANCTTQLCLKFSHTTWVVLCKWSTHLRQRRRRCLIYTVHATQIVKVRLHAAICRADSALKNVVNVIWRHRQLAFLTMINIRHIWVASNSR